MPFTVSHVAAVLPGHRPLTRLGVFSAAVIGSMVPDFGFLLPGNFTRWQTHSFSGLWNFSLPVGLAAFAVTLLLIKPAVLEALPDGPYARIRAAPAPSLRQLRTWLYAAAAVLLGTVTHLVWDNFTHENTRGIRMFPLLSDLGPQMRGHPLHLYTWGQYISSVVGLLIVIAALLIWLRHAVRPSHPLQRRLQRTERCSWALAYTAVPLLAMGLDIARHVSFGRAPLFTGGGLGEVAIWGMRGAALSLVLISVLIRLRLMWAPVSERLD